MKRGRKPDPNKPRKPQPPQPLVERCAPSKACPEGRPRCQRWAMRDGAQWQCSRPAREGFPVCGIHGAGYAKREKAGERLPIGITNLVTGHQASQVTLLRVREANPALGALFEARLQDPEVYDMRPRVALAQALLDQVVSRKIEDGDEPQVMSQIQALLKVVKDALDAEERMGPITHEELRRLTTTFAQVLREFVPPEMLEAAKTRWQGLLVMQGGRVVEATAVGGGRP